MNPRIIKEVRLLFGPWCLIVVAALLPLLSKGLHHFNELSSIACTIGFFGGIPFMAALSLGGEFQQRTFALLLGQPVQRHRIWMEKQAVLLVALASTILIFLYRWNDIDGESLGLSSAWLLATVSSATFWTLLTRSTLGGLAMGQFAQFLIGAALLNLGFRILGPEPADEVVRKAMAVGGVICLTYSGLMLWLGWRKLARFEATGGIAGDDLLMVGPRMLPAALAELLRCRPTGSTLNLIRKELRLLRPLWLITLLFLACWFCIVVTFRIIPQNEEWKEWRQVVPLLAVCLYMPLCVMLAGCLSLGEERTSGAHAWHLTLPVSARRQWFIKLVMALGAGVFCAMVVPFLAISVGQFLLDSPFGADFKWGRLDGFPLLLALFASFPAFWCACAVNGTVRAALWTLPVMCALCFVGAGGFWAAEQLVETTAPLITIIVAKFQLNPRTLTDTIFQRPGEFLILWLVCPTLLMAVIQSCRLFRTQPGDRILPVIRSLLPLALVALLSAFSCGAFAFSVERQGNSILVLETRAAIAKLHIDDKKFSEAHPLKLSVDDLAKISPMSELTRQWLRNASVEVFPVIIKSGKRWGNAGIIRFEDGSECQL